MDKVAATFKVLRPTLFHIFLTDYGVHKCRINGNYTDLSYNYTFCFLNFRFVFEKTTEYQFCLSWSAKVAKLCICLCEYNTVLKNIFQV